MIKKKDLSQGDNEAWAEYIKNPSGVYDKDNINSEIKNRKNRYKFDLHGFSLSEANKKVEDLIIFCSKNNYREILLITGKGIHSTNDDDVYVSKDLGKLKFSVPDFIESNKEINKLILSIDEADVKEGGKGAILIKLKNLQNKF